MIKTLSTIFFIIGIYLYSFSKAYQYSLIYDARQEAITQNSIMLIKKNFKIPPKLAQFKLPDLNKYFQKPSCKVNPKNSRNYVCNIDKDFFLVYESTSNICMDYYGLAFDYPCMLKLRKNCLFLTSENNLSMFDSLFETFEKINLKNRFCPKANYSDTLIDFFYTKDYFIAIGADRGNEKNLNASITYPKGAIIISNFSNPSNFKTYNDLIQIISEIK